MTENPLGYEKIPELLKNFAIKLRNQKMPHRSILCEFL